MQKPDIRKVMDNYIGEKATPEKRARANEFVNFLEQQADVKATLLELKTKCERELNISPEQIRSRRRKILIGLILLAIFAIAEFLYFLER